jgi:hypothetical protein
MADRSTIRMAQSVECRRYRVGFANWVIDAVSTAPPPEPAGRAVEGEAGIGKTRLLTRSYVRRASEGSASSSDARTRSSAPALSARSSRRRLYRRCGRAEAGRDRLTAHGRLRHGREPIEPTRDPGRGFGSSTRSSTSSSSWLDRSDRPRARGPALVRLLDPAHVSRARPRLTALPVALLDVTTSAARARARAGRRPVGTRWRPAPDPGTLDEHAVAALVMTYPSRAERHAAGSGGCRRQSVLRYRAARALGEEGAIEVVDGRAESESTHPAVTSAQDLASAELPQPGTLDFLQVASALGSTFTLGMSRL